MSLLRPGAHQQNPRECPPVALPSTYTDSVHISVRSRIPVPTRTSHSYRTRTFELRRHPYTAGCADEVRQRAASALGRDAALVFLSSEDGAPARASRSAGGPPARLSPRPDGRRPTADHGCLFVRSVAQLCA